MIIEGKHGKQLIQSMMQNVEVKVPISVDLRHTCRSQEVKVLIKELIYYEILQKIMGIIFVIHNPASFTNIAFSKSKPLLAWIQKNCSSKKANHESTKQWI